MKLNDIFVSSDNFISSDYLIVVKQIEIAGSITNLFRRFYFPFKDNTQLYTYYKGRNDGLFVAETKDFKLGNDGDRHELIKKIFIVKTIKEFEE